jgi:AcrR family transcriptional regulator
MAAASSDTRDLLLAHARDVYLEGGPAGFSLREVARRSGVSAAAVYRHFEDKEALLRAVCDDGFRIFSSYLLRALGEATPKARLLAAGDEYRKFALENPRDYRFIFMSTAAELGFTRGAMIPERSATFQLLVDRTKECIASGDLAPGNPVEIATVIWAHVHGLASLRLSGHLGSAGDDAKFAKFCRASTERLLLGFAP